MFDPPQKDIPAEEVEQAKDPESGGEYDDVKMVVEEDQYPMRTFKFTLPFLKDSISFNPAVTIIGLVPLWGLTIYCMVDPTMAKGTLATWFSEVIDMFTWFYIVANPVLTFFIAWVAYRYGHIKLGKQDAEPEFSNATYFAMIFSAGIGVGLFFYGVSEPLWHSEPDNYYSNAGYHSQDEINQYSLVITL
jgi:choline-glycine betaine transporter